MTMMRAHDIEKFAMENCLMILSSQSSAAVKVVGETGGAAMEVGRMFSCKTCGRKFPSFQALGGHRASHKKVNKPASDSGEVSVTTESNKVKSHACTICGVEFPIGQALGGHMRRHRPLFPAKNNGSTVTTEGSTDEKSDGNNKRKEIEVDDDVFVPVLKKTTSSKRVCLDLNLNFAWKGGEEDEDNDCNIVVHHGVVDDEAEKEETVEQKQEVVHVHKDESEDFLKLELRLPVN